MTIVFYTHPLHSEQHFELTVDHMPVVPRVGEECIFWSSDQATKVTLIVHKVVHHINAPVIPIAVYLIPAAMTKELEAVGFLG